MNATNKLFTESLRPEQGDNRNYFVKALNQIIEDGFITIAIQTKGRIWTNPRHKDNNGNLKKFNIEIKGYNFTSRIYDNNFSAKDLLTYIADFIQADELKGLHKSKLDVMSLETCECDRCNGMGFIKAFDFNCNGLCFQCYGSKYMVKKRVLSV
jgi:hypothetical protein